MADGAWDVRRLVGQRASKPDRIWPRARDATYVFVLERLRTKELEAESAPPPV